MADMNTQATKQKPRRVYTALLCDSANWGVSVSEKKVRKFWLNTALLALGAYVLSFGLVIALPLLAGLVLPAEMTGGTTQTLIVGAVLGLAVFLSVQSRKGPRNTLQLDHKASELRLGFVNRYGAFVRQRVIPLAKVDHTFVQNDDAGQPELHFVVNGKQIRLALADAKGQRLSDIATQINEAASRARIAPRPSRIQSAIAGIGASYREIGNRVVTRVCR